MIKLLVLTLLLFASSTQAQQVYNKLNVKELDVTSRVNVTSTTKSSKPCPAMTETQRNAIATPLNGSCIYNTTTLKLNVYNGSVWKAAGGGVDNWLTTTAYSVDDIVIQSSKIYQCLIAHTSGTFATDLAALKWAEISSTIPVNLTGPITSVGNATSIASQTGTGSTFVVQTSPTLTTPNIGVATGTSLALAGNITAYNYDKDNLLVNGNIENPLSTEWTCTVGTCTRTTVAGEFSKDSAALKVALSAQTMNVSQTVTTPSGIQKQGFARAIYRVPATMADFQICTLVDAAEQTCVPTANLIKDDTFRSIEIPLTFGSTSAGIKFKTTSSYSANAYFDGAILSQGLGLQSLSLDTDWATYTPTFTGLGTVSPASNQCKWKTEGDDLLVSCRLTSHTPAASLVSITLPNNLIIDTSKILIANTTAQTGQSIGTWNQDALGGYGSMLTATGTSSALVYIGQYISAANQLIPQNGSSSMVNSPTMFRFRVPVVGKSSSANVYSQASGNTDWAACTFSTLAWQGLGTVTNNLQCRKNSGMLEMRGKFIAGTTTANQAQIPLPSNFGTITTASSIIANEINASLFRNISTVGSFGSIILQPSVSYLNLTSGIAGSTSNPATPVNGNTAIASSETVDIVYARIPISGWTNSSAIVGSFENVPTVPGAGARIDTFSVSYGTTNLTTVCSGTPCFIDQIGTAVTSVTRSGTGSYSLNLNRTYSKLKCSFNPSYGTISLPLGALTCTNCSTLSLTTQNTTPVNVDTFGTLLCQGTY